MNFDLLNEIVAKEAGVDICPICETPFRRRDIRQKTCGADECKRLWKNKYLRERRLRLIAEDKELFNFRHAEAQRKSRHKKRTQQLAYKDAEKDTMSAEDIDRLESLFVMRTPASEYAERQKAKTLASIPKIDVNLRKEEK